MNYSTNSTATWSGAHAATSSICQPTVRSETSGSAGQVTSQSSPQPPTYLFDVEDFLREWLANLSAEQRAADGMVPSVVPDVSEVRQTPFFAISCSRKHRDLERRGRLGAVGAVAGVRGSCRY